MKGKYKVHLLKDNDLKTFEQLCSLTQQGMKKTMSSYLKKKYSNVIETKDYIMAEGDIPIALVAHMDTVFPRPAKEIFYDRVKNVIWSPDGLGADDRAGIFAIIYILRHGLRPHIILTTDEERGAVGASYLAMRDCPFEGLRYLIQLDRRGGNDCVFYDCANEAFIKYIESFGFAEAIGSFSDISVICPAWKVAGVNLSIGYRDEHSMTEVLFVNQMFCTINKVIKMLSEKEIPAFEYVASPYAGRWYNWIGPEDKQASTDNTHCKVCGKEFTKEELIPVNCLDGSLQYYCIDCISGKVDWCQACGEAYEIPPEGRKISNLCEDCWNDFYYGYNY